MSTEAARFSHNPEKIAFLTDSCADLSPKLRKNKPVFVVPLHVRCTDGEFLDGEDIFAQDIYRRQQLGEMPGTSLPSGGRVSAVLDEIAALGYEKVAAVHLSSGLSGTYNMIRLAAEDKGEHIAMLEARKQYAWYLKGVPHANYYKEQIVQMNTLEDMERITAGIKRDLK